MRWTLIAGSRVLLLASDKLCRHDSDDVERLRIRPSDADKGSANLECEAGGEDSLGENVPEFTSLQMHAIIDMVVTKLSANPRWKYIPIDGIDDIVADLKARYWEGHDTFYTRLQARSLMELAGRMFGEALENHNP